eukprot:961597-Prymnesium_polylepis.1
MSTRFDTYAYTPRGEGAIVSVLWPVGGPHYRQGCHVPGRGDGHDGSSIVARPLCGVDRNSSLHTNSNSSRWRGRPCLGHSTAHA